MRRRSKEPPRRHRRSDAGLSWNPPSETRSPEQKSYRRPRESSSRFLLPTHGRDRPEGVAGGVALHEIVSRRFKSCATVGQADPEISADPRARDPRDDVSGPVFLRREAIVGVVGRNALIEVENAVLRAL